MKLATIRLNGKEVAAILTEHGFVPLPYINKYFEKNWPEDILGLLVERALDRLNNWFEEVKGKYSGDIESLTVPEESVQFPPLYRGPRKIWGIGLNYKAHAEDLSEKVPTSEPASFMKPDTTITGYGDTIKIPVLSNRTTGEAELALIFGRECKNVPREEWSSVLAGFTTIIDMTAEDILRRNPRNLTQSKSFDTFLSFGPILYTVDEVKDVFNLKVQTVINGKVHAENVVSNMTFPPDYLVYYHTQIMTMLPGDVILTGTPGAVPLKHGDVIECRITGFKPLKNYVIDLKVKEEEQ